jgi:L-ribulose-5-phosphate 4-epimerase
MEEGYIKFKASWERCPALPIRFIRELNQWRQKLYQLNLIGAYADGIGFGNISRRFGRTDQFIISGSGTGTLEILNINHYSLVTYIDVKHNRLECNGPVIASSESMSHGVIYRECPTVNGIIHVHHKSLWQKLRHKVPTTGKDVAYGTPELAYEIIRLLEETDLRDRKIIVTDGHEEGIFTFGESLDEAGEILLEYYRESGFQTLHPTA